MTPQSKQRVLVVGDEKINRTVLVALLRDEYQVILAKTGEQALERLCGGRPESIWCFSTC